MNTFKNFRLLSISLFLFLSLLAPITLYAQSWPPMASVTTDGLVVYYPFNGNANDESGNGNHGTVNGAVLTSDMNGNNSSAYKFDGVDDYINTPVGESLPQTISVWVKPDGAAGNNFMTVVDSDRCSYYGQGIEISYPGKTPQQYQVDTHNAFYDTGQDVKWDVWQHVVAVYTNANVKFYHNSVFVNSQDYSQGSLDGNEYTIGSHCSDNDNLKGVIDEVRIYNRALSESEILELYNEGGTTTCTYSISSTSESFDSSGGTGSVSVGTASDCSWTATSNASWIMIITNDSGIGDGAIDYSVSANTNTSSRTGTITIAGETFTVTQEGSVDGGLTAPTNFSSSVGGCTTSIFGASCTVSFSWTGVNAASGYKLYFGFSSGSYEAPTDLGNVTSDTFYGVPDGTYYLAISAYDSSGNESGKSEEIALIVGESSTPTNFSSTVSDCIDSLGITSCTVSLNWTGVSGSSGYYIYYGSSPGNYTGFADVGYVTSLTFAGIAKGTYYLALTSYDSGGLESGYSDELILEVGSNSVNKAEKVSSPFAR